MTNYKNNNADTLAITISQYLDFTSSLKRDQLKTNTVAFFLNSGFDHLSCSQT